MIKCWEAAEHFLEEILHLIENICEIHSIERSQLFDTFSYGLFLQNSA